MWPDCSAAPATPASASSSAPRSSPTSPRSPTTLRDQVLGNLEALIAHRQNVPESAELIAAMAGTRPAWITTQQTDQDLLGTGLSGKGTRTRGYEYEIHPSQIKRLPTGHAAVITPGSPQKPTIAQIHHPSEAHE